MLLSGFQRCHDSIFSVLFRRNIWALRKMNTLYGDALKHADQCSVDCDAHFGMSPDYRDAIQAQ